ncbi:MAG: LOG family protein [Candidatus Omnitrophica bacterium]|nr:LOG family protein [Candidatus Omnitrophota bacterium]
MSSDKTRIPLPKKKAILPRDDHHEEDRVPKPYRYSLGIGDLDEQIRQLIKKIGDFPDEDLIQEIIVTALKLYQDQLGRADVKLINSAFKELRYAFRIFQPYHHIRKVALFGSARTPKNSPTYVLARDFARGIAHEGWMVITGASSGIMNAGNEGAGRAHSFGCNIRLPFEQMANPVVANDHKLINFKYFFTRKLIFIRESDATVLCPGGFGTHDEGFETLTLVQTGKTPPRPVVCLDRPESRYWREWVHFVKTQFIKNKMIDPDDINLIYFTHDPHDAVHYIVHFYHNYHSIRYIRDRLVFRIKRPLSAAQLSLLNEQFAGILKKGKILQFMKPFPEEANEPYTHDLIRLAFYYNRRRFVRLKDLIMEINKF